MAEPTRFTAREALARIEAMTPDELFKFTKDTLDIAIPFIAKQPMPTNQEESSTTTLVLLVRELVKRYAVFVTIQDSVLDLVETIVLTETTKGQTKQ